MYSGQGPEGCNLFVFHIPNDMTNLKLYELFVKFGDVVSARIMVDKVTRWLYYHRSNDT